VPNGQKKLVRQESQASSKMVPGSNQPGCYSSLDTALGPELAYERALALVDIGAPQSTWSGIKSRGK
jgi:hypothetical protein